MSASAAPRQRALSQRLARAVGSITGPGLIGAALGFLSTPLLVHWFSPREFGFVANALAASSILSSVVSLRLEVLLYRARAGDRPGMAWQATLVSLANATLLLCVALPLTFLARGSAASPGAGWTLAVYILLVSACIANIGTAFLTAEERYWRAGQPKLVSPLVLLGAAALARTIPALGDGGLLAANVSAALVVASLYVASFAAKIDRTTFSAARALVAGNRRYVFFAALQNSIAIAGFLNLGMILIGACYGQSAAGQVFMAFRLVGFPSTVLGVAAANFIMAEAGRQQVMRLRGYALTMVAAGLLIYLPLLAAGLAIPSSWLPPEWRGAEAMLPPMILLCAVHFIIGSFGQLLLVWNRAGQMLVWDVGRLAVPCLLLAGGWAMGESAVGALWLFVLGQLPFYLLLGLLVRRAARAARAALPDTPAIDNVALA